MEREELPLLELDGVTVRRDGNTLVEGISLRVDPGTIHVLSGPNGGGKTTLLKSILGQVPFEGTIRCHWRRDGRIGYVPQTLELDRELPMTVSDFLSMMWQSRPVCLGSGAAVRSRVAEALEAVGLSALSRRQLGVLSGGELRRALLAQALDPIPELLLLDEPTAGIEEQGIKSVEETLVRLKKDRGVTAILVSHDLTQADRVADYISVLNRTLRSSRAVGEGA